MSGQAWKAAWNGWFDGSSPLSSGVGVSRPASASVWMHACIVGSSKRAWFGP